MLLVGLGIFALASVGAALGFVAVGTVVLAVSAISLLAALTLVVSLGWRSPVTIGLFVVAAATAACWVVHERRADEHPPAGLDARRRVHAGPVRGLPGVVPRRGGAEPARGARRRGGASDAGGRTTALRMLPPGAGRLVHLGQMGHC
jgi:hypothetical protein